MKTLHIISFSSIIKSLSARITLTRVNDCRMAPEKKLNDFTLKMPFFASGGAFLRSLAKVCMLMDSFCTDAGALSVVRCTS